MTETDQHLGVIKSYGLKKGFGFITCEQIPDQEVFFASRALPREVLDSFAERSGLQLAGKTVAFTLLENDAGKLQAGQVALVASEGEDIIGRVKSYNGSKGFGFLTSSSVEGDIFFSRKDLPGSFQDAPLQGAVAKFQLAFAADGKPQGKQVTPQVASSAPAMPALPWAPRKGGGGDGPACFGKGGWGGFGGYDGYGGWGGCGGYDPWGGYGGYGKGGWGGGGFGGGCRGGGCGGGSRGSQGGGGGGGKGGGGDRDRLMHGVVKSYDSGRGFGFILCPEIQKDVYFQGQGDAVFAAGDRVSYYMHFTPDGKAQARSISPGFQEGEQCEGSVKSYNAQTGFGFVQADERPGDVYFKKDSLPSHLKEEDLAGRPVKFTVRLAPDGKPQVGHMDIVEQRALPAPLPVGRQAGVKRRAPEEAPPAKRVKTEPDGAEIEGSVKSYNMAKGWGFIRCHNLPQDVYFKGQHPEASPGARVRFTLVYTPDGKPQANGVHF